VKLHSLEIQFSLLDKLPDSLYLAVVTHTHGELLIRIEGILQWRTALLAGQLPVETRLVWPEKSICRTVLMRLEALDMLQYCQAQEALTDSVLESILEAVSSAEDQANKHGEADLFNDELAQRQKKRDRDSVFKSEAEYEQAQSNTAESQDQTSQNYSSESVTDVQSEQITPQYNNQTSEPISEQYNNTNKSIQQEELADSSSVNSPENISKNDDSLDDSSALMSPVSPIENPLDQSPSYEDLSQGNSDLFHNDLQANDSELSSDKLVQDTNQYAIAHYAADHLEQKWQDLAQTWHELSEHYDGLARHLGLGWDLSQGILASDGWRNIIQHRKRIKNSPYLKKLVAALGRLREYDVQDETESLRDTVMMAIKRQQEQLEEITTPYAINDTGGIKRGDDIARLLPSELSLLGHPQLNLLWHVKRAERTLLSYQLQGLSAQIQESDQEIIAENSEEDKSTKQGYGPIIICLDTSASMQGEPEQIAKALVLEAVRIATDEARACYVYSFGGQKQVLEHELDLSQGGLSQLLNFLQQSFTGGTDVSYALRKALHKQTEAGWETADILLISDGRFPPDQRLEQKINTLKKHSDLRIHGVLLGKWRGQAIQNICDPLHRFADIAL
jgi:uncharacterized protein with von Willebrand factor type A (vWA) domain